MRRDRDDASDAVQRKVEDARREMERAQRKLEELYREREKADIESGDQYYSSESHGDNERVRIRVRENHRDRHDRAERDHDRDHDHASDRDHEYEFEFDVDHDFDFAEAFDIDIEIDDETIERISERIEITLDKLGKAFVERHDVNAVDMGKLRDLFPGTVAGMKRVNIDSSSDGAFGFRVSQTSAEYEGQRTELKLTVIDLGSLGGIAREGMEMLEAEIDRESDDEYVRTTRIEGHPAKIHFEKGRRYDTLNVVVMVADRFVFAMEAEGTDLSEALLEDVLNDFSIDDIEDLD